VRAKGRACCRPIAARMHAHKPHSIHTAVVQRAKRVCGQECRGHSPSRWHRSVACKQQRRCIHRRSTTTNAPPQPQIETNIMPIKCGQCLPQLPIECCRRHCYRFECDDDATAAAATLLLHPPQQSAARATLWDHQLRPPSLHEPAPAGISVRVCIRVWIIEARTRSAARHMK
jgi:hypothetical protein